MAKAFQFITSPLSIIDKKLGKAVQAIGLIALGAATGNFALIAAGVASGASLFAKGPKVTASQNDRLTASVDPRAFRKSTFGQTAMSVDVRYEEWSGPDQENCDWIVALASHSIDGIEEIWLNTEMAWSATTGVVGKYAGYFSVPNIVLEGTPANAFTFASGKWNAGSAHLTGCAYLRLRFKVTGNSKKAESPFSSGIPSRITIIGRGAKLYDPRRDDTVPGGSGPMRWNDQSTWRYTTDDGAVIGENLPLQILRILLGWRIRNPVTGETRIATGSGVPGKRIDFVAFQIAANLADELVNRSAGGNEPRYHGAAVISEGDDPKTALDMLCAACCGRFRDTGGKLSLMIAHNDLAAAATDDGLNDDDVVGGFSWNPDPSLEQTPNVARGKYVDASTSSLYQLIDYPEVRLPSPDGQDRYLPIDLGAVESPSQAQRIVRQILQRRQYAREFSAPFDIRAWKYGVGDVVPFTFAALGFTRVTFRVKEQELGQNGVCNMTLTYETPLFYQWDADDFLPVQAAEPIVYDSRNNPLILAIGDAAGTALWDGVTGAGKPADNATNGADLASPFGESTVGAHIVKLADLVEVVEPIPRVADEISALRALEIPELAGTIGAIGDALSAIDAVRLPALDAGIAAVRVDGDAARRQQDEAVADLSQLLLFAVTEASRARTVMRDAGVYIDAATGQARLYATEAQAERLSQVAVAVDAVKAQVSLTAKVSDVKALILAAQLDPSQVADLTALIARITSTEILLDGLNAALSLKADARTLTGLQGTITSLSQQFEALAGSIVTKAETSEVTALATKLSSVQQTLLAYGDQSLYSIDLRQARATELGSARSDLLNVLTQNDTRQRQVAEQADLQFQLTTTIVAGLSAEAAQRIALAAQMAGNQASVLSKLSALATTDLAQAQQLTQLGASLDGQSGLIQQLADVQQTANKSIATLSTDVRQVADGGESDAAGSLAALIAGDGRAGRSLATAAAIHTDLTTTIVAGQRAQAEVNQQIYAQVVNVRAALVSTQTALTTLITATTRRLETAESAIDEANARIARAEDTFVEADRAQAAATETLRTEVGENAAGLADARVAITNLDGSTTLRIEAAESAIDGANARIAEEERTSASAIGAQAERVDGLLAVVNDPATGLAKTRADVASQGRALAEADQAIAETIEQVSADVDGIGGEVTRLSSVTAEVVGKVKARLQDLAQIGPNIAGVRAVVEMDNGDVESNLALIAQAIGLWLQLGPDQFVQAVGVEIVDGIPRLTVYGDLEVNAAVVPIYAEAAPALQGVGRETYTTVLSTSIVLKRAGLVRVWGKLSHSFTAATDWGYRLLIGGVEVDGDGGSSLQDVVSIMGARACQPGTIPIVVQWAANPTARLRRLAITGDGLNNTTLN